MKIGNGSVRFDVGCVGFGERDCVEFADAKNFL